MNKMKRQPTEREKLFANKATNKGLVFKIYEQLMQLYVKKKKKMGRTYKQTSFQRRYTDGQKAHEKIPSITNYWRNTNQNYNEVSLRTSQNGHYQSLQTINKYDTVGENVNWYNHCGEQYGGYLKN